MTDKDIADHVYIEPLNLASWSRSSPEERPDSILPTLGGQTGLNLAMNLHEQGILEKYGVRLLGTSRSPSARRRTARASRTPWRPLASPASPATWWSLWRTRWLSPPIGYPVIVRPRLYPGRLRRRHRLRRALSAGDRRPGHPPLPVGQVLIERCISGWKEIEFEVMRDSAGNVIQICSMENIDPVGVHTGDSIVVAPPQTLANREYQMLRSASLDIISALEIEGGCNVQLALNPDSFEYAVIEVNPRVSRSSALASKATGYPIAKVAAKVALGLHPGRDPQRGDRQDHRLLRAHPGLLRAQDPRLPFDKFTTASRTLGTQMKATGEVMAIGNSFEGR